MRALTRNPDKHRDLADEVVEADLNRPETLAAVFKEAYGAFLVTTSSLEETDERKQGAEQVHASGLKKAQPFQSERVSSLSLAWPPR